MTTASKLVALVSNQKSIMKCTVLYAIGASKVSDTHTDSDWNSTLLTFYS